MVVIFVFNDEIADVKNHTDDDMEKGLTRAFVINILTNTGQVRRVISIIIFITEDIV